MLPYLRRVSFSIYTKCYLVYFHILKLDAWDLVPMPLDRDGIFIITTHATAHDSI